MKEFIKDNWYWILGIFILIAFIVIAANGLSSPQMRVWLKKPASNLTAGDVLILVLVHAWINRSDNKCECKK